MGWAKRWNGLTRKYQPFYCEIKNWSIVDSVVKQFIGALKDIIELESLRMGKNNAFDLRLKTKSLESVTNSRLSFFYWYCVGLRSDN